MRNEDKLGLLALERQSEKALFNSEEALERSAFGKTISKYENDIKNMFCLNSMCHNSKATMLEDSMYNLQLALLLQLN